MNCFNLETLSLLMLSEGTTRNVGTLNWQLLPIQRPLNIISTEDLAECIAALWSIETNTYIVGIVANPETLPPNLARRETQFGTLVATKIDPSVKLEYIVMIGSSPGFLLTCLVPDTLIDQTFADLSSKESGLDNLFENIIMKVPYPVRIENAAITICPMEMETDSILYYFDPNHIKG